MPGRRIYVNSFIAIFLLYEMCHTHNAFNIGGMTDHATGCTHWSYNSLTGIPLSCRKHFTVGFLWGKLP